MKTKRMVQITFVIVLLLATATAAYADIILDNDGVGFVGKGDVQLLFGWNNAQLQACAWAQPADPTTDAGCLRFELNLTSDVVTEVSWECTNENNDKIQERERTTTTTTTTGGITASVARVKTQVTGFYLNGGNFATSSVAGTEGPPVNSCPSGPWTLTTPAGDPAVVSEVSSKDLTVTNTFNSESHIVAIP